MKKTFFAIFLAVLAAVFYALQAPFAKLLLDDVPPAYMASFLYIGAGGGVFIMYLFRLPKEEKSERLTKADLPYTVGMILLDIAAPLFMMYGLKMGTASSTSLLGNFEIVATSLVALFLFREKISPRLWCAILLITAAGVLLSLDTAREFRFSVGALFVLLATLCWGLENNCTRKIANKSTYQIVTLKGIFSGFGAFLVAWISGADLPAFRFVLYAMLLGFAAYGLSIFVYVRAQRDLGAAKTSAFYAVAPFVGVLLSFVILHEPITPAFLIAFGVMILGGVLAVLDSLLKAQ